MLTLGFRRFPQFLQANARIRPFPDDTNIDAALYALLTASQYKLQEDFI